MIIRDCIAGLVLVLSLAVAPWAVAGDKSTKLLNAVEQGNLAEVERVIDGGFDVNAPLGDHGNSLLHAAALSVSSPLRYYTIADGQAGTRGRFFPNA
jgi:hypothetical protein